MPISTKSYAVAAVSAVAIGLVAVYLVTRDAGGDRFSDCRESKIAGGAAAIGGPFTLTDEDGRTVTEADVLTKPSLVYFGYTFLPRRLSRRYRPQCRGDRCARGKGLRRHSGLHFRGPWSRHA